MNIANIFLFTTHCARSENTKKDQGDMSMDIVVILHD